MENQNINHISKTQFRIIVVASLVLAIMGGAIDILISNPTADKILEYAFEIEPFPEGWQLVVLVVSTSIAVILGISSFVGLLLFKRWARILYISSYLAMIPMYLLMGVSVYGSFSQLFYDLSMITSGAILVLIYFSNIASYFENEI